MTEKVDILNEKKKKRMKKDEKTGNAYVDRKGPKIKEKERKKVTDLNTAYLLYPKRDT